MKKKTKTTGNRSAFMARKFRDRLRVGRMIDRRVPMTRGGIMTHVDAPSALAKFFTPIASVSETTFSHEETP